MVLCSGVRQSRERLIFIDMQSSNSASEEDRLPSAELGMSPLRMYPIAAASRHHDRRVTAAPLLEWQPGYGMSPSPWNSLSLERNKCSDDESDCGAGNVSRRARLLGRDERRMDRETFPVGAQSSGGVDRETFPHDRPRGAVPCTPSGVRASGEATDRERRPRQRCHAALEGGRTLSGLSSPAIGRGAPRSVSWLSADPTAASQDLSSPGLVSKRAGCCRWFVLRLAAR